MSTSEICVLIFAIGFVTGLRALTPPAAVAWAAHLGWLNLHGTPLSFLGSTIAVAIFTLGAVGEFIADQLPTTPNRTAPVQLGARIVMGSLSGAAIALATAQGVVLGIVLAAVGAVIWTFAGFHARRGLVRGLKSPDFIIATLEDIIAISFALLIVTRF
jgi:uncharacterized membrane protein